MNIKEWFAARGCQNMTYLGDGVYAATDGYQIWLVTERAEGAMLGSPHGMHYIALDSRTMKALVDYDKDLRRPQLPDDPPAAA